MRSLRLGGLALPSMTDWTLHTRACIQSGRGFLSGSRTPSFYVHQSQSMDMPKRLPTNIPSRAGLSHAP